MCMLPSSCAVLHRCNFQQRTTEMATDGRDRAGVPLSEKKRYWALCGRPTTSDDTEELPILNNTASLVVSFLYFVFIYRLFH